MLYEMYGKLIMFADQNNSFWEVMTTLETNKNVLLPRLDGAFDGLISLLKRKVLFCFPSKHVDVSNYLSTYL